MIRVELPRSHLTETPSGGVNAVLFGLAAIPAAVVALMAPSPAKATEPMTAANAMVRETPAPPLRNDDEQLNELVTRIGQLVSSQFGGNLRAAFDHYAGADGEVHRGELGSLLKDAGEGNAVTRGVWAHTIMSRLDGAPGGNGNSNSKISWAEFSAVMR